jgi:hypothetical protein
VADLLDQARAAIEARLKEIGDERAKLEQTVKSLTTKPVPKRRRASAERRAASTSHRKRPKRARRGQRQEQVLAALDKSPGATPTQLAKTIGITPNQVHGLISTGRKEKLIVRSGEGYARKVK